MSKQVLYLDTCAWIIRQNSTTYKPEILDGIREIFRKFDNDEIILATSVLTLTESKYICDKTFHYVKSLRAKKNFHLIQVTSNIAELAAQLRVDTKVPTLNSQGHPTSGTVLTPDAIHLVSAAVNSITHMVTTDRKNSTRNGSRGLLQVGTFRIGAFHVQATSPCAFAPPPPSQPPLVVV